MYSLVVWQAIHCDFMCRLELLAVGSNHEIMNEPSITWNMLARNSATSSTD